MSKPAKQANGAIVIRDEWPRIREWVKRGRTIYEVDCRRPGTNGKQQYRASLADAEKLAEETARLSHKEGVEGLTMSGASRAMAIAAEKVLEPFGKTVLQAAEFYAAHLRAEKKKEDSRTLASLADEWVAAKLKKKASGELSGRTMDGIRTAAKILKTEWGATRILAFTTKMLEDYLDGLKVSILRKENVRSLISQFLNWAIGKKYCAENIATPIEIVVPKVDGVTIFNAARAKAILELCVTKHPELLAYCAVSLFAGLRPGEAGGLTWDNVHLKERTIHILGSTSKTGETHNVHMEDNLFEWLKPLAKKDGPICPTGKTLERRRRLLHADLGYRVTLPETKGEDPQPAKLVNPDAPLWPQDVLRHSYASHWLAKYGNRAQLAENMCNSVDVIRDHYKKVVSKAEMKAYWAILPATKKKTDEFDDLVS